MDEINWETEIPATGVPVVERMAAENITINNELVRREQRVRLYLDASGYELSEKPGFSSLYFGSGSHQCLGMPLGISIWRIIVDELKKINRRVLVENYSYRPKDNVFNCLEKFQIRIT